MPLLPAPGRTRGDTPGYRPGWFCTLVQGLVRGLVRRLTRGRVPGKVRDAVPGIMFGVVLVTACAGAQADIYGYIDSEGAAHFSTERLDSRYQVFMRGDQTFDSERLRVEAAPASSSIRPALLEYLTNHPNLKKYEVLVADAAREFSVDPALLKAVMAAESGFNPAAVSPKGAVGLMQIMPATAERYGLQQDRSRTISQKLTDPKTNIRLAARYLRDLHRMFPGQKSLVMASYNAGEGAVQKYRNTIPPYPETQNYVKLVSELYRLYGPVHLPGALLLSGSSGRAAGAGPGRVYMTIPGRGNMPPLPVKN